MNFGLQVMQMLKHGVSIITGDELLSPALVEL